MGEKQNTKITIELTDKQQKMYDEWMSHIKGLYGKYGKMTWSVSDCGIGQTISVHSELAQVDLDLTDIESW